MSQGAPVLGTTFYLPNSYERARQPLIERVQKVQEVLNRKTTGEYRLGEINTSQTMFGGARNNAPVFRTVVDFGSLPNSAMNTAPHGISFTDEVRFLKIYGAATDSTNKLAISIPSPTIDISLTASNVVITTTANYSTYDGIVVLEYTKIT